MKPIRIVENKKTTIYQVLPRKRRDGVIAVAIAYWKKGKLYCY